MTRAFFLYLSQRPGLRRWLEANPAARRLTRRFIAGETLEEELTVCAELAALGILTAADHLGENVTDLVDATAARDAYLRALELDPGRADAHVNLGRQLHVAGEPGRAEPHYREAVRIDPDDPTPHFNLGVLLEELKRRDEAIHAYRQAILRDPDFADAHCNLGLLLDSLGRRQEALGHLMAARRLNESEE